MAVIRLWKPYGVQCRFTDPDGRPTLADFVSVPGVYPAGRLDHDSEGLVILTDLGWLQARLTQPRFHHPKTYLAQVEGRPDEAALATLRAGPLLSDGPTRAVRVERLLSEPEIPPREPPPNARHDAGTTWLRLVLTEGRNRQVRRMTGAIGHPTLRLVRWAVGRLDLRGLHPGESRELSATEIRALVGDR